MKQELVLKEKLPEGWKWITIEDAFDVTGGDSAPQEKEYFIKGDIPFVRMQDVGRYHFTTNLIETVDKVNRKAVDDRNMRIFPKGTILMPRSGSVYCNHRAVLGIEASVVSHLACLIPKKEVSSIYAVYYLATFDMTKISSKNTGLDVLSFKDLKKVPFLLPPLQVQKQIVAKLDAQMAHIEIMKKEAEKEKRAGEEILVSSLDGIFNNPNWKHAKFKEYFSTKYGLSKPSVKDITRTKAVRMNNITYTGELVLNDICYLDLNKDELEKHKLKKGDLIFNRTNSAELVGKNTYFDNDETYVTVSYLVVASPKNDKINSEFISYYLNSSKLKKYFLENCDRAISQANFSASKLGEIQIPIPDIKVQDELCKKVRLLKEEIRFIQQNISQKLSAISQLTSSLLNEVFGKYEIPEVK